jgi:hypothetical protein
LRLWPAISGAQIELTLTVRRTAERKDAPPYQVSAAMLVAQNPSRDRRLLTPLVAGHLVNPVQVATEFRLTGFISVEQLRVVEELRSGADSIWVVLQVSVTCVDGEPTTLVDGSGEFSFTLPAGEWSQELERVDAATYVEILVPLTNNAEHANAVRRLRNARTLIQDDRVEEALAEARKALEFVRKAGGTVQIVQQAKAKNPRDRDLRERWAYLVEDIFSLLSGPPMMIRALPSTSSGLALMPLPCSAARPAYSADSPNKPASEPGDRCDRTWSSIGGHAALADLTIPPGRAAHRPQRGS